MLLFLRRAAHDRAQMHGVDDLHVRVIERQTAHGSEDAVSYTHLDVYKRQVYDGVHPDVIYI